VHQIKEALIKKKRRQVWLTWTPLGVGIVSVEYLELYTLEDWGSLLPSTFRSAIKLARYFEGSAKQDDIH
jgi:hypothetical protein